jgi:transcription initiation protein SPT3
LSYTAKRFREYLNLPHQLELRSDDTIDILGFLAFETVRALTIGGLEVKRALEEAALNNLVAPSGPASSPDLKKRKLGPSSTAPSPARPSKRLRGEDGSASSYAGSGASAVDKGVDGLPWSGAPMPRSTLFLERPEARTPLTPQHIQDAFARMQRQMSHTKGAGLRNWQGGLLRTRISLI